MADNDGDSRAARVPRPRLHLIRKRFHGVLAHNAQGTSEARDALVLG
jgi:hypothetical protein